MSENNERLSREREAQRVVNAYHRVFGGDSEDGNLILADLVRSFGMEHPAFVPVAVAKGAEGNLHGFDAIHAAKRDGQQDIRRHIAAKLAAPLVGDGNVAEPRTKVIT